MKAIVSFIAISALFLLNTACGFTISRTKSVTRASTKLSAGYPYALIVTVEIKPERIVEFLKVIEEDAIGSRERENGGCLRFDVMRSQSQPNQFVFYEVYKDEAAALRHKEMPHFKLWTDFKTSGGVLSQSVVRADAIFAGKW
jgi:quinol monooxygenase YgiN